MEALNMKKRFMGLLALILVLSLGAASAATYTLPEKLQIQLSIGNGLKGTFTISSSGELAGTPFLKAVSDAEYSLRGMSSGEELHYYVFQTDQNENMTGMTELYRKDDICYLRSDMVQGTVLSFPSRGQLLDSQFPATGANPTISTALIRYLSLSAKDREDSFNAIWNRYGNELEFWLADFTMDSEVVTREDGNSALNFTYHIPGEAVRTRILSLFNAFGSDTELQSKLDTVMTQEQKSLYVNAQLGDYYRGILEQMDFSRPLTLTKQVSSLGEVFSSGMELPLDSKLTGYQTLKIDSSNGMSTFTLSKEDGLISLSVPDAAEDTPDYEKTIYFRRLSADNNKTGWEGNLSLRADITKTLRQYNDEEERSHQTEHYSIVLDSDESQEHTGYAIPAFERAELELDLHYYSKFSQNSATTLEVDALWKQSGSSVGLKGQFKTASPWLFMPFDVGSPVAVSPSDNGALLLYLTDWISNAQSLIHHTDPAALTESAAPAETAVPTPIPVEEEETEEEAAENPEAEASPLDDQASGGDGL